MIREIDAASAIEAFRAGRARLIDVRQPMEYALMHVPGSELHPIGQFDPSRLEFGPDEMVILICASGQRSASGCMRLAGRKVEAFSLRGGIGAWRAAGGPIETKGGLSGLLGNPVALMILIILAGLAYTALR